MLRNLSLVAFAVVATADEGCCFTIGYGSMMKPCCLVTEMKGTEDCLSSQPKDAGALLEEAKTMTMHGIGGDGPAWRQSCPTSAGDRGRPRNISTMRGSLSKDSVRDVGTFQRISAAVKDIQGELDGIIEKSERAKNSLLELSATEATPEEDGSLHPALQQHFNFRGDSVTVSQSSGNLRQYPTYALYGEWEKLSHFGDKPLSYLRQPVQSMLRPPSGMPSGKPSGTPSGTPSGKPSESAVGHGAKSLVSGTPSDTLSGGPLRASLKAWRRTPSGTLSGTPLGKRPGCWARAKSLVSGAVWGTLPAPRLL
ncbi:unnamed protein product [Effrenium voratum]|nr:unnamed protein product [Effrenium voratum]